jgi:hypothetical protein
VNGFPDHFAGYFAQYGYWTIAGFARFIVGLRVFAGPLAGVLRMAGHVSSSSTLWERRPG